MNNNEIICVEVFNDNNQWEMWSVYKGTADEDRARKETLADYVGEDSNTEWVKENYKEYTRIIRTLIRE